MAQNLTKRDIVLAVHSKLEESANDENISQKAVRDLVQHTLDTVAIALSGGQTVELRNFGVFEVLVRKQRVGRNPNQPETDVVIPRRAVIKFKPGKELKAAIGDLDLDRIG
jgi:nucleoid DNA-binding protein